MVSHTRIFGLICLMCTFGIRTTPAAERNYAPDRTVDIRHITIDVTPDFQDRTVAGTTTIRFAPINQALEELRLDAVELDVSSVTSSAEIKAYHVTDEAIVISFDPAVPAGTEASVSIVHEAEPKQGLYFRTPEMGYPEEDTHIFTQGEAHEAPHWYPNYDYPNDRSSSELICRVPAEMTVVSNGRLVSETIDASSGLKVAHWLQEKPHVNYLIALVAGKFKKIESKYKDIPLAFYTPASLIEYAPNSFQDTADMMAYFEQEIGIPYPWHQYNQAVVRDFVAGGMENTTLTILTEGTLHSKDTETIRSSQSLVAHELVHQWFGDYVTCKDWSHLWLNEGFATYYEDLYDGHKNGRDRMLGNLYVAARSLVRARSEHKPIVYRAYRHAGEQFDYRAYGKAGWVLHMLRTDLGPELFNHCVKVYLERHALDYVVTDDFRSVLEEITGRSFDRFFDQWIYHGRHPDLKISYAWQQKGKLARVSVEQTHKVDDKVLLFHFRSKLRFIVDDQIIDREIAVNSPKHDFYFALPQAPQIVRFDPDYGLLADIQFSKPNAMLYAQLKNTDDIIGRLRAVEALKKKKDKKSITALKAALNNDSSYRVRRGASSALRQIRTDDAFDALAGSLKQPDARVRLQVVSDIGGFYRPESLKLIKRVLSKEKNPAIIAQAIRNLGAYHDKGTRKRLLEYLKTKSYRNSIASAVIEVMRKQDDAFFIAPLQQTLAQNEGEFTSYGFSRALDTLAQLSRDEDDRTKVRRFLCAYVNHPNRRIQPGAIRALGTLGDPKAIPVVETFSGDDASDRIQRAAKDALRSLRENKPIVPEEIVRLRETVDKLNQETEKLRNDLEDMKDRLDAKEKGEED